MTSFTFFYFSMLWLVLGLYAFRINVDFPSTVTGYLWIIVHSTSLYDTIDTINKCNRNVICSIYRATALGAFLSLFVSLVIVGYIDILPFVKPVMPLLMVIVSFVYLFGGVFAWRHRDVVSFPTNKWFWMPFALYALFLFVGSGKGEYVQLLGIPPVFIFAYGLWQYCLEKKN